MEKKLFHPTVCPVCRGEARHRHKLLEILLWLAIVAVSGWILLDVIGMAVIAWIAKYGPTWQM